MDIVQFSAWNYKVTESNNWVNTKPILKRIGLGIGEISVRVTNTSKKDGAVRGKDYTSSGSYQNIVWKDGDLEDKEVIITIIDDNLIEGEEIIPLKLSKAIGCSLGEINKSSIIIVDNDYQSISKTSYYKTITESEITIDENYHNYTLEIENACIINLPSNKLNKNCQFRIISISEYPNIELKGNNLIAEGNKIQISKTLVLVEYNYERNIWYAWGTLNN